MKKNWRVDLYMTEENTQRDVINDRDIINDIVEVITERILTPVIYLFRDEILEFVCFCDTNMPISELQKAEMEIYSRFGVTAELVDIRSFDESDRWEIVANAELVYTANDIIRSVFETAMFADVERSKQKREEMIERHNETGTYYMQ